MSNEKQMGVATNLYASEFEGFIPVTNHTTKHSWDDLFADFDGRGMEGADKDRTYLSPAHDVANGIYRCPSDVTNRNNGALARSYAFSHLKASVATSKLGVANDRGVTGVYNTSNGYYGSNIVSIKVDSIADTGDTLTMVELQISTNLLGGTGTNLIANGMSNAATPRAAGRNLSPEFWVHDFWKMNILFADGHVELIDYEKLGKGIKDVWTMGDSADTRWAAFHD